MPSIPGIMTSRSTTDRARHPLEQRECAAPVLGGVHLVAPELEQARQIGADALGVVDDQDARVPRASVGRVSLLPCDSRTLRLLIPQRSLPCIDGHLRRTGRVNAKRLPPPLRSADARCEPPCASTMRLQIASPRPSPLARALPLAPHVGLEDPIAILGGDRPGPRRGPRPRRSRPRRAREQLSDHARITAAGLCVLDRVAEQVGDHLLDRDDASNRALGFGREIQLDFDSSCSSSRRSQEGQRPSMTGFRAMGVHVQTQIDGSRQPALVDEAFSRLSDERVQALGSSAHALLEEAPLLGAEARLPRSESSSFGCSPRSP